MSRGSDGFVPGKMRCAKCNFAVLRMNLNVNVGTVTAGDNVTERCPNGCGPLWPMTWEQEARDCWEANEAMFDRMQAAEKALVDLQARLRPVAVPSEPEVRAEGPCVDGTWKGPQCKWVPDTDGIGSHCTTCGETIPF